VARSPVSFSLRLLNGGGERCQAISSGWREARNSPKAAAGAFDSQRRATFTKGFEGSTSFKVEEPLDPASSAATAVIASTWALQNGHWPVS